MPKRLHSALTDFKATSKILELYGILGITIGGARTVEVPDRDGFVYVRLRDSTSELIQAFNETVSPVYDLPVKLKRDGNRYYITGRDTQRYQNWGTVSPFLPRHGDQHSFNDTGGGGDIVWVYQQQFMPMLALPSGTLGGPNVLVANVLLRNNTGWIYAGGTGTFNLVQYKPTNNQAIMGLVYINRDTGNPGFLINSGTPFAATLTGTASIAPYIPYPSDTSLLPVAAIRLVSGTQSLVWGNMYEARQLIDYYTTGSGGGISSIAIQDEGIAQGNATTLNFVGAGVTASVSGSVALVNVPGGGSTTPGGSDTNVQYNVSGTFGGDSELVWNYDNRYLRIGPAHSENLDNHQMLVVGRTPNAVPLNALFAYGTGTATAGSPHPTFIGYRQRGLALNAPEAVRDNDGLVLLVGAGYQGDVFTNSARVRLSAQGNWITGTYSGSKAEIQITPSGTNTRVTRLEVVGNGANIPDGTYMISGSPHSHAQTMELIADHYLTSATGSFVFTGIPQNYRYIKIFFNLRSDRAGATADGVLFRINGLSTSIYDYLLGYFLNGAAVVGQQHAYAGSSIFLTYATATTAPSGTFVSGFMEFNNYTSNFIKVAQSRSIGLYAYGVANDGNMNVYDCHLTVRTTLPITSMSFTPNTGPNWVVGSRISLYGIL